jgi:hypothetical protein
MCLPNQFYKKMVRSSKKGNGEFPRKLFAILALAAMSMSGHAADNSIYIDQSGDNSTITITQDGAGNTVRGLPGTGTSNQTPAKIWGDNNTVVIDQIGSGNMLKFGIVTTTGGTGTPSIRYSVTGNDADATIKSMNPGAANDSPIIDVQQSGNFAFLNINQTGIGPNNSITAVQSGGSNNSLTVNQSSDTTSTVNVNQTGGGGNTTEINQSQGTNNVSLTTVGASNATTINQTGDNQASINITGSGNTTALTQTNASSGINTFNYTGSGSGNSVTVLQNK